MTDRTVVFNNGQAASVDVSIRAADQPPSSAVWKSVSGHKSISGTVSGSSSFQADISPRKHGRFTTARFSGDTEVTLAIFTEPLSKD